MNDPLKQQALELLNANTLAVDRADVVYRFATPTGDSGVNAYRIPKFQWTGWDSQFHAIVYAALGEYERAADELRSIFAQQRPDGFIPHVAFWENRGKLPLWTYLESKGRLNRLPWRRPHTTDQIQPPVLAESVWMLFQGNPDLARIFLQPTYRYYRWLADHRDPDNDGLISVIAQSETGLDYSPAYDPVNGYQHGADHYSELNRASRRIRRRNKWLWDYDLEHIFSKSSHHVEDVLVNSIFIRGLQMLARLAHVSRETSIEIWAKDAEKKALVSLLEKSYDPHSGLFWNLLGKEEYPVQKKTVISLMPLIVHGLPHAIVRSLFAHLTDENSFWTEFPVPSTPLDQHEFSAKSMVGEDLRIWRGPLSMNINWYIMNGLRHYGYNDEADTIKEKSQELIRRHSFNEFYDPLTGEPCGADKFGWATLAAIM